MRTIKMWSVEGTLPTGPTATAIEPVDSTKTEEMLGLGGLACKNNTLGVTRRVPPAAKGDPNAKN